MKLIQGKWSSKWVLFQATRFVVISYTAIENWIIIPGLSGSLWSNPQSDR